MKKCIWDIYQKNKSAQIQSSDMDMNVDIQNNSKNKSYGSFYIKSVSTSHLTNQNQLMFSVRQQ